MQTTKTDRETKRVWGRVPVSLGPTNQYMAAAVAKNVYFLKKRK